MIDEARSKQLLGRVLARIKGAEAIATLSAERRGHTRFARNEVTTSGDVERQTLSVTVQLGKRQATSTTNQLDEQSIDNAVASALRMAKLAPENPEAMPVLGKQTYIAAHGSDPGTVKVTPEVRAQAVGAALAGAGATVLAGFLEHAVTSVARATTAGLWAHHESTECGLSCTARTQDGTGSGWAGAQSHRFADLEVDALTKTAVDKATRSAHPQPLAPGRYTVVLEPAAVSALLGFLIGQLDQRRADEKRSFFGKPGQGVGARLFGDTITVKSDPTDASTGGMPFDREGFALRATRWIDKGVLTALPCTRFWASKQGKTATGQPDGWTLEGGTQTPEQLIKGVERGVLITRFFYLRDLDPQLIVATGLTRDGTFLIEKGEIKGPVNNFRFNESPLQMLAKCDALGPARIAGGDGGNVRAPWLRTHEFNLASVSEAI